MIRCIEGFSYYEMARVEMGWGEKNKKEDTSLNAGKTVNVSLPFTFCQNKKPQRH